MNRRNFLKGVAGLAAVAAATPSLAALVQTDRDRFMAQVRNGGVISRQVFRFYDRAPLVLANVSDLEISDCRFIWVNGREAEYVRVMSTVNCLSLISCDFCDESIRPNHNLGGIAFNYDKSRPMAGIDVEVENPNSAWFRSFANDGWAVRQ